MKPNQRNRIKLRNRRTVPVMKKRSEMREREKSVASLWKFAILWIWVFIGCGFAFKCSDVVCVIMKLVEFQIGSGLSLSNRVLIFLPYDPRQYKRCQKRHPYDPLFTSHLLKQLKQGSKPGPPLSTAEALGFSASPPLRPSLILSLNLLSASLNSQLLSAHQPFTSGINIWGLGTLTSLVIKLRIWRFFGGWVL